MTKYCFRCKQVLVCELRQCSVCLRNFYPSCSKLHSSYRGANSCCFRNLKTITVEIMQPVKETSSKLMLPSVQSSPSGNFNLLSSQKNSTIETTLNASIAQQSTFNERLMQMINDQNEKFVTQQTLFNNKLTDMMDDQNGKLTEMRNLAKTVADQQLKINKLEMQNSNISKSVADT